MQKALFNWEMPDGWNHEQAWERFQPYASRSYRSVDGGVSDWRTHVDEYVRGRIRSGDEALVISSLIFAHLMEVFQDEEAVTVCNKLGMRLLIVENALAIRFKRLSGDYTARPTNSEQDERWWNNQPIDGFSNYLLRLTVGYTLEGEALDKVYLTWQSAVKQLGWKRHFTGDMEGGAGVTIEFSPPNLPLVPIMPREEKRREEGTG